MIVSLALLALPAWLPLAPQGRNPRAANRNQAPAQAAPNSTPGATPPASAPSEPQQAQQGGIPTVQESGEYYILTFQETAQGLSLEELTKLCQQLTGKNFTYDDPTAQLLSQAKIRMFGQKRIPKAEFYSFYQILMFINQFVLTKVGPDHLAVILVQPVAPVGNQQGKANLKNEALYLMPEELDRYADQVATQVITVLHLPHTDVRTLGNSLRGLTNDTTGTQGVVPVGNTNSVILTGFASNVASLARILRLVDEESAKDIGTSPAFEVIPLEFAAAEDMADVLEQLLEASKRANERVRVAVNQGATGQIPNAGGGETKIMTDPRTNSLLVMALPEDMQNIKELVARLDVDVIEPERNYHVYALENVKAEELSDVLEDFIEGASRVTQAGPRGAGAQPGQAQVAQGGTSRDNEVIVVPDPATNSLLIAASKRRYEEVVDLVRRLDRRQDQVLIETALIELSGRNSMDIGVELGFANLPGTGTGGFGVTSFGLGTFIDSNGDGIIDTKVPGSGGANSQPGLGITAGILDGDDFGLPLLIAALKDRRDTNVLNIPSVLVNNNGSAVVKSIDSQPTTQVTAVGGGVGGTTQENFQDYQDAGITMQISPSISASGYLRLDISLEVSNFLGVFSGPIPPPKVTRTIQTTVNVPNGDTMVIGGIVTDNKDHARTSLPWFGDLPVVGFLFRRDTENSNRTTLYFFVTPHILRDKNFADLAEISYKIKLNAADKIGADRIRIIDHGFTGGDKGVDLGGFELPIYRSPRTGEVAPESVGIDPVRQEELLRESKPPPTTPPASTPDGEVSKPASAGDAQPPR